MGCGQAKVFVLLNKLKVGKQSNFFGVEPSETATEMNKKILPEANFFDLAIEDLTFGERSFDRVCLLEVIEHIPNPDPVLQKIKSLMKDDGFLYLSFPNYYNLPWLVIRLLADVFNKPNWIVRQPIDHIYNIGTLRKILRKNGLKIESVWGGDFLPHPLYKLENENTDLFFNRICLSRLGFHPVLKIIKLL